jgi:hypothetical protein
MDVEKQISQRSTLMAIQWIMYKYICKVVSTQIKLLRICLESNGQGFRSGWPDAVVKKSHEMLPNTFLTKFTQKFYREKSIPKIRAISVIKKTLLNNHPIGKNLPIRSLCFLSKLKKKKVYEKHLRSDFFIWFILIEDAFFCQNDGRSIFYEKDRSGRLIYGLYFSRGPIQLHKLNLQAKICTFMSCQQKCPCVVWTDRLDKMDDFFSSKIWASSRKPELPNTKTNIWLNAAVEIGHTMPHYKWASQQNGTPVGFRRTCV